MSPLVSPQNNIWRTRVIEISYWWNVTTQIWVMLLINHTDTSTNQNHYPIWVMTHHQYGTFVLVPQTSFHRRTSGSLAKCWLFSQSKWIVAGCFLSPSELWLLVRSAWWLFWLLCFRVWHWTVLKSHCQEYSSMDKHMLPFHEQEACKDSEFWTLTASVYELTLMSYVIMQGYREIQNWCNAIFRMKIKRTFALHRKNPAKDPK